MVTKIPNIDYTYIGDNYKDNRRRVKIDHNSDICYNRLSMLRGF